MKSNDEQIKKFTKRPIRYWFEDGIGELVTGGLFGLIGVYLIIQQMVTSPIWIGIFSIFSDSDWLRGNPRSGIDRDA